MKKQSYRKRPEVRCNLLIVLFFLLFFSSAPVIAEQSVPDQAKKLDSIRTIRKEKVATFKAAYPKVQVETNPVTGGPEDLWGDLSKNQTKTEPLEAAYEFFEQNKGLYGITNPREELKLQYSLNDQYGAMVDFKQLYRGVEIYRSSIRAYFTPAGKLKSIKGGFLPIIGISTAHSVDSGAAVNLAKKDLSLPLNEKSGSMAILGERGKPSASLVVFPAKGKYYLAWVIKVWGGPDNSLWEYFIDAKSGEILRKEDTAMDYSPREKKGDVSGYEGRFNEKQTSDPKEGAEISRREIIALSQTPAKKASVLPAESVKIRPIDPPAYKKSVASPSEPAFVRDTGYKAEGKGSSDSTPRPVVTGRGQLSPAEVRDVQKELDRVVVPDTTKIPVWQDSERTITDEEKRRRKELIRRKRIVSDSAYQGPAIRMVPLQFPEDTVRIEKAVPKEEKKSSTDQSSSAPSSPTALIYSTWWTNVVDCDQDLYASSAQLKWDPDVNSANSSDELWVYEEVWSKASGTLYWFLGYTTGVHLIRGREIDSQAVLISSSAQQFYDFRVEIYRSGQSLFDDYKDNTNDPGLGNFALEGTGDDQCPTAEICCAWWTNEVNCDNNDIFKSSARLNWDSDVVGCFADLWVYEKIWYKLDGASSWNFYAQTPEHFISGCSYSDGWSIPVSGLGQGFYDWKIEVYRSGGSSPDFALSSENYSTLNNYPMETSAQDPCPVVGPIIWDAFWTNKVDCDGDGHVRSARLNWDPDFGGCSGSATVYEILEFKLSSSSTWLRFDSIPPHVVSGCSTFDIQYVDIEWLGYGSGLEDWRIKIYRTGQTSPSYIRDSTNDVDLVRFGIEGDLDDPCILPDLRCIILSN